MSLMPVFSANGLAGSLSFIGAVTADAMNRNLELQLSGALELKAYTARLH